MSITGKIHKTLSLPHIRDLKAQIAAAVERAQNDHQCVEVMEEGVIDFLIAPMDMGEEVRAWLAKKGISGGMQGPRIETDEIARIRQRLETENEQLPKDKPGIIVIYARSAMTFLQVESYENLASELEETVYSHPNLILGVIVTYGYGPLPETPHKLKNFMITHRQIHDDLKDTILIIKNRYPDFAINEDVVKALINDPERTDGPQNRG